MTVVVTIEVVNESVWQKTTPVPMVVQDSTVVVEVTLGVVEPTQYGPNVHVEVVVPDAAAIDAGDSLDNLPVPAARSDAKTRTNTAALETHVRFKQPRHLGNVAADYTDSRVKSTERAF